ncbi:b(0,+)-type amino acid transporter 1 [Aplysia californica]|uniref:B(0,+)-type amino acid transporter 1 n=1 Tax=Aplysia californica TaxID=6500 RepID=A0ABM0ZUS2_APLCA|nr:b(0,+)-type amino acid transporter 1 [Aplysia californica]
MPIFKNKRPSSIRMTPITAEDAVMSNAGGDMSRDLNGLLGIKDYDMMPEVNGNKIYSNLVSEPSTPDSSDSGNVVMEDGTVKVKQKLGLLSGTALIVGTMIGSGIFISPKGVIAGTGSVALSLIVWVACGMISLFGALAYAELGTLITKSGAEYAYLLEAGKSLPKTVAPVPAFLFSWVSVFVLKPSLFAVISLSFGIYVIEPFYPNCEAPDGLVKIVSVLCICMVAAVNCHSVALATRVQNFFTVAKLLAVLVIVVGGFYMMAKGHTEHIREGFDDTSRNPSTIALAFYDGLWAYDGWNNLNYATEELKNPYVNLPRAIMLGIPLVTVCYLLTNLSYLAVMSKETLLASNAVAATWGESVLGSAAVLIPIFVALSTFGAANGSCFTGGRLVYAAAREGHLPEVFSYIHIRKATPLPSLLLTTLIAILMMIPGDIFSLIDFFSFAAWLFYGGTMASVIVLRYSRPNAPRPYRVPTIIPIVVFIISVYLVVAPIIQEPRIEFLYASLFILSGLIFYIPFVGFNVNLRFLEPITTFLQCVLEVAPSKYEPPE